MLGFGDTHASAAPAAGSSMNAAAAIAPSEVSRSIRTAVILQLLEDAAPLQPESQTPESWQGNIMCIVSLYFAFFFERASPSSRSGFTLMLSELGREESFTERCSVRKTVAESHTTATYPSSSCIRMPSHSKSDKRPFVVQMSTAPAWISTKTNDGRISVT